MTEYQGWIIATILTYIVLLIEKNTNESKTQILLTKIAGTIWIVLAIVSIWR